MGRVRRRGRRHLRPAVRKPVPRPAPPCPPGAGPARGRRMSNTAAIAIAGSADPRAAVLVALAACGAFLGDNAVYLLGRRFGPAAGRRVFAGERGARRRAWAERSLQRFGARMIIGCRFIPGGRTAVTLTCGLVGYSRRRFVVATAFAAVIWASY